MHIEDGFKHEVPSPPLLIGAALLIILIVAAGISPLIYSFFN
ncbi:MAG: hypothetical protein WC828_07740 [Thermoleophilia bacterium]|jgi:hypothetical protein